MELLDKIKNIFKQGTSNIAESQSGYRASGSINRLRYRGAAVFNPEFLMSLSPKDYPKYLKQSYYVKFGEKLNLRNPKTINEKIQWLKIYHTPALYTTLTDKLLVRDWVKDKIGSEYLKPLLWSGKNYDEIPFDNLPESLFIQANHGCKWNVTIKNKSKYLQNIKLAKFIREQMEAWLDQNYFYWSDFETQYKDINPCLMIEELLEPKSDDSLKEFEIWCFNSQPKIFYQFYNKAETKERITCAYDEDFKPINLKFLPSDKTEICEADEMLKKAVTLSKKLCEDILFARVDWIKHNDKLYFNEITFTPHSGFIYFTDENKEWNLKLGNMLKLKGI